MDARLMTTLPQGPVLPQATKQELENPNSTREWYLELTGLYAADLATGIKTGNLWKIRRSSTQLEGVLTDLRLTRSVRALIAIQRAAALANLTELPDQLDDFLQTLHQESSEHPQEALQAQCPPPCGPDV